MAVNQKRIEAGIPTGGEFAVGAKAENTDLPAEVATWSPSSIYPDYLTTTNPKTGETAFVGAEEDILYLYDKRGLSHADGDRPAFVDANRMAWYKHGHLHRDGLPAEIFKDGTMRYYREGQPVLPSPETIQKMLDQGIRRYGTFDFISDYQAEMFNYGRRDFRNDILGDPWPDWIARQVEEQE